MQQQVCSHGLMRPKKTSIILSKDNLLRLCSAGLLCAVNFICRFCVCRDARAGPRGEDAPWPREQVALGLADRPPDCQGRRILILAGPWMRTPEMGSAWLYAKVVQQIRADRHHATMVGAARETLTGITIQIHGFAEQRCCGFSGVRAAHPNLSSYYA